MIPMLIGSGYNAIAVWFDVWDIARRVKDVVNEGREVAGKLQSQAGDATTDGDSTTNGDIKLPGRHTNGSSAE